MVSGVNGSIGVNASPAWIRLLLCSALAIGCLLGASGPARAATLGLPVDLPLPGGGGTTSQSQPATLLERAAGATVDGAAAPAKPVSDTLRAAAPAVPPTTAGQPAAAAPSTSGAATNPHAAAAVQSDRSGAGAREARRDGAASLARRDGTSSLRRESAPDRTSATAGSVAGPAASALGAPAPPSGTATDGPAGGGRKQRPLPLWPSPAAMSDWLPGWSLVLAGLMLLLGGVGVRRLAG